MRPYRWPMRLSETTSDAPPSSVKCKAQMIRYGLAMPASVTPRRPRRHGKNGRTKKGTAAIGQQRRPVEWPSLGELNRIPKPKARRG
jgi:hypothetical protein